MKVRVGDNAPGFSMDSVNKGHIELSRYSGANLVLVFGRYFGCPVCQDDFDALIELSGKTDVPIIYFTQSLEGSARKYLEGYDVDFPVIPVPKAGGYKIYKDYGVGMMGFNTMLGILRRAGEVKKKGKIHGEYQGRETQSPADFVINGDGMIIRETRGLLDTDSLLEFLRTL
ncbi:redoxin domain-containing protein [Candidatus Bathyarchaeota archaeon]|nr:redoxin domain-containing protein [Candidatus Bathyarchaeota archaeon]